jgi:hypothetical protein
MLNVTSSPILYFLSYNLYAILKRTGPMTSEPSNPLFIVPQLLADTSNKQLNSNKNNFFIVILLREEFYPSI